MSKNRWERRATAWRLGAGSMRKPAGSEVAEGLREADESGSVVPVCDAESPVAARQAVQPSDFERLRGGEGASGESMEEIEVWRARCADREKVLAELDRQAARLQRERDEASARAGELERALATARTAESDLIARQRARLGDRRRRMADALRAAVAERENGAAAGSRVAVLERLLAEAREALEQSRHEKRVSAKSEADIVAIGEALAESKRALGARDEAIAAWEKRFVECDENLRRIQRTAFDLDQDLEEARRELAAAKKAESCWRDQLESLREEQRQLSEVRRSEQDRFKRELRRAHEAQREGERERIASLETDLVKAQALHEERARESEALREELAACLEKLKVETEARHRAGEVEERRQAEMDGLRGKVDLLQSELAESRDEADSLRRQCEVHDREQAQGQAQQEDLREALKLAETHAEGLRTQLQAAEAASAHFEKELDSLRDQMKTRTAALRDREVHVGTLQNELSGFSSLLGERDERISSLEGHLASVRREHLERETTLKRALAESAKNRDRLESALADARLEAASSTQSAARRSREQEADLRQGREALAIQVAKYEALQGEFDSLKEKLHAVEQERDAAKESLAKHPESGDHLSQMREEVGNLQNVVKIKNQQILLLRKRLNDYDDLRKRLLEANDEIARLQNGGYSREQSEQVLDDLKAWKDQLDRYKEAIDKIAATKDREIADLKDRLAETRRGRDPGGTPAPSASPSRATD